MAPRIKAEVSKQQSLAFASKRSTAVSNTKAKGSKSPATIPSTPVPIKLKSTDGSEMKVEEVEVKAAASVPQKRRSVRVAKAEQGAGEGSAVAKKRKLEDIDESTSAKGKGKGKGKEKAARGKAVFKSRVSIENTREVATRREQDSSDIEPDISATDDSVQAKRRRMSQHYALVREKMGHLQPSKCS